MSVMMDDDPSRKRRWPLATRRHGTLLACAGFSLTTATFLAYHLHYFSTFLVYIPFTLICIPALAVFDATHLSSWDRWAAWRRHRFWICALWCLFILFAPTYPSSFPLSKHTPIPPITSSKNGTYFIAANLYNSAKVLPSWTRNMKLIIKHIGPRNVFISIYESNSQDGTQEMLRKFKDELAELGVANKVVTEEGTRGEWGLNSSSARISYMAGIRNKVLEPLRVMGDQDGRSFEKVIFFNDVYFDWRSIVHLINTKDGDYDLACALDFDGVGMYDTWVLRDACGGPTKEVWPYVPLDPTAIDHLRKGEPFEVAACWNGVASFDASWFLSNTTKRAPAPNKPPLPLQFRESHGCTSSECYLIALDMHFWTSPNRPKIYVNPQVNVAYEPLNFLFHTKLEKLTVARPWQWIWQDWIGHRMFGWWTDRIWLKEYKCDRHHSLRFVKADYCE